MWLLGGWLSDVPNSFGYSVGTEVHPLPLSVFSLHNGASKTKGTADAVKTQREVSIFVCKFASAPNPRWKTYGNNAAIKSKSIKHPSFLKVLDVAESAQGIYIATEHVRPLTQALKDFPDLISTSASWGLTCLAKGLDFLHGYAKSHHGHLSPESVFVTDSGEWRLGMLELSNSTGTLAGLMEELKAHPACALDESLCAMTGVPRAAAASRYGFQNMRVLKSNTNPATLDRMAFAHIAAYSFAASTQKDPDRDWRFKVNAKALPPSLSSVCEKMLDGDRGATENFNWEALLEKCSFFGDSELKSLMEFLDNLALKGTFERERFFQSTFPVVSTKFSGAVQSRLLLPRVIDFLDGGTGAGLVGVEGFPALVGTFLSLISTIDDENYFHDIAMGPLLKLLESNDRAIRYLLLQGLNVYKRYLTGSLVIPLLDSIVLGMNDTSVELRDVTLRSMLVFIPLVTSSGVSISLLNRVLQVIGRLLRGDENDAIRMNANVCVVELIIGESAKGDPKKIVGTLKTMLIHSLSDRSHECRLFFLNNLNKVLFVFTNEDITQHLLPLIISKNLSDPSTQAIALKLTYSLLGTFEQSAPTPPGHSLEARKRDTYSGFVSIRSPPPDRAQNSTASTSTGAPSYQPLASSNKLGKISAGIGQVITGLSSKRSNTTSDKPSPPVEFPVPPAVTSTKAPHTSEPNQVSTAERTINDEAYAANEIQPFKESSSESDDDALTAWDHHLDGLNESLGAPRSRLLDSSEGFDRQFTVPRNGSGIVAKPKTVVTTTSAPTTVSSAPRFAPRYVSLRTETNAGTGPSVKGKKCDATDQFWSSLNETQSLQSDQPRAKLGLRKNN